METTKGGFLILVILALLVILKMAGMVNWSWWIVLCPLWIPIALVLAFTAIIIIAYVLLVILSIFRKSK